jgi:RNA polymerase sigma-70 factor (sigma-E family)
VVFGRRNGVLTETVTLPVAEQTPVPSFADQYRAESASVASLAYLLTGDRHLAEDLMQEAFLRVGSRLRHVSPETFGPYVRRTVVNLARSHFRKNGVRNKYAPKVETEAEQRRRSLEDGGTDFETREELWAMLQDLPARQREAIVCRFYLDMSESETADALGISLGTVKSSTSRGLAALRAAMQPKVDS